MWIASNIIVSFPQHDMPYYYFTKNDQYFPIVSFCQLQNYISILGHFCNRHTRHTNTIHYTFLNIKYILWHLSVLFAIPDIRIRFSCLPVILTARSVVPGHGNGYGMPLVGKKLAKQVNYKNGKLPSNYFKIKCTIYPSWTSNYNKLDSLKVKIATINIHNFQNVHRILITQRYARIHVSELLISNC